MSNVRRTLMRGLDRALQEQLVVLYRVLADPSNGPLEQRSARFTKGLTNATEGYFVAEGIIEEHPLPE